MQLNKTRDLVSGYDPAYGARPLRRFITMHIETPLAKEIVAGKILPHSTVTIGLEDNKLTFDSKVDAPAE